MTSKFFLEMNNAPIGLKINHFWQKTLLIGLVLFEDKGFKI